MIKIVPYFVLALLTICSQLVHAQIPYSHGRIAISCDGNYGDDDDWAATPATLMMLAKARLQDSLVLYTYSDHVWESNSQNDIDQMRTSINGSISRWKFNNTNFIEAVSNPESAYNAMRDAINASSATDPLIIICAGPMHVVGTGMERANEENRQFVTLISHSNWNDTHACEPYSWENHDGWCWSDMESEFTNVNFIHIIDQNSSSNTSQGFSTATLTNEWSYWYWMRDHNDESVQWVYNRMEVTGKADMSDAGMVWYLLHDDEYGNQEDLKVWIGDSIYVPDDNPLVTSNESINNLKATITHLISSDNKLHININQNIVWGNISIIDLMGRVAYSESFAYKNIDIYTGKLKEGVYIIKVDTDRGSILKKMIL